MPVIIHGYNVGLLTFIAMFSHDALGRMAEDLDRKVRAAVLNGDRTLTFDQLDEIYIDFLSLVRDHPIARQSAHNIPGYYGTTGITVDDVVDAEARSLAGL